MGNRIRGLLAEFGLSLARSSAALRKGHALASQDESLLHAARAMATEVREHLEGLDERIARCDREIAQACRADPAARRLQDVTGVGPTSADALVATVGNARDFRIGRQFAAWVGLTPRQHSSGGKTRLGGITRRGDAYL